MSRAAVVPLLLTLTVAACRDEAPSRDWSPGADADVGPGPSTRATPTPANEPVGTVEAMLGSPTLQRDTSTFPATTGAPLYAGDRVNTAADSKIRIMLADKSVLAIGPRSSVVVAELSHQQGRRRGAIRVVLGQFWMNVTKWTGAGESVVEVSTPNAVAGVRGTTLWGDVERDVICALEGQIEVRSVSNDKATPARLAAGNCAAELSKGKLTPLQPDAKSVQSYLDEVHIR